jgi:REP element-mobilizing transposase RayT
MNPPEHAATKGPRRPPHFDAGCVPYFVSTRAHRSRRIFVGRAAEIAVQELGDQRNRHGFLLRAFAFMPDHAHFVVVPHVSSNVSGTMRIIKGSIARRVNEHLGISGPLWQEGFFDRVARTRGQLHAYIEYVHQNPVAARLVDDVSAYPYSSGDGRCMADYHAFFEEQVR